MEESGGILQKPLVLFTCIVNRGGMSRVSKVLSEVKKHVSFKLLIFSPKQELFDDVYWIKWSDEKNILNDSSIEFYKKEVNQYLQAHALNPSCVVGDIFTLPYFDDYYCNKIFDTHTLAIPMFKSIEKEKEQIYSFERNLKEPFSLILISHKYKFIKFEFETMLKADGFISYSLSTTNHLKRYYFPVVKGKAIYNISLTANYLKSKNLIPSLISKRRVRGVYSFGRFHPQKGLGLLLSHEWKDLPLTVRGFDRNVFRDEFLPILESRNITNLKWTSDEEVLRDELLNYNCVLFPSLYEPWGLALSEALRLGCICICHKNDSGHHEQIEHLENGYLIDMRSKDLVAIILQILKNKKDNSRISRNAALKQIRRDELCIETYKLFIQSASEVNDEG